MLYIWHYIEAAVFRTVAGRIIAAVIAGWLAFQGWLYFHHDPKVKREVVSEINESGERLAEAAEAARGPAKKPGAWERLRKTSCYDC